MRAGERTLDVRYVLAAGIEEERFLTMAVEHSDTDFATVLRQAENARERLVLAVGPTGSGKTAWLRTMAADFSLAYFSLGPALAAGLSNVPLRQRPLALARTLEGLLPAPGARLCLDNTDLLFLPELQCDPLRFVAQLSQHRLVLAAFTGAFADGRFTRAYPDHPEYLSRPLSGLTVASFSLGVPTFFQT